MRPRKTPNQHSFKRTTFASADGQGVTMILPTNHLPVFARPGNAVQMAGQKSSHGVILACLPDYAVVLGDQGETVALTWAEVELVGVQPDPAHVLRAQPGSDDDARANGQRQPLKLASRFAGIDNAA